MISRISKYKVLLQDFSAMYFVVILRRVLGIVTTYFLVRVLTEGQYAEYVLVLSYLGLFGAFTFPELSNALMQATARGAPGTYFKSQKIMFFTSCTAGLVLLGVAYFHSGQAEYSPVLFRALVAVAVLFPVYAGIILWKPYRLGLKEFKVISGLDSFSYIITNSIIIYLLVFHDVSNYVLFVLFYMMVPGLLNMVMSVIDFRSDIRTQKSEDGNVAYGIKTSLYSLLHTVALQIDNFLLFYFISPQALAYFAVANRIPEMLRGISQTLAAVLAPRFAQKRYISADVQKSLRLYYIVFGLLIFVFTFTLYPPVMLFLFSDAYESALLYSQVLLCSIIIANIYTLGFRYVRSHQDTENYKNFIVVTSLVKIVTVVVMVPFFGVWGAVGAIVLHRFVMMMMVNHILRHSYVEQPPKT